jgi:hypothetical protein
MTAVSLAYLPLHAITINGMMETLLRNANEHPDGLLPLLVLFTHEYNSQREGCQ